MMIRKILATILVVGGILFSSVFGYRFFLKSQKPLFETTVVKKGNILQEVLATGQVKRGEEISLAFKDTGRIEKIFVKVGEVVEANTQLAKLETKELEIQLKEARANLTVSRVELEKLLAGATKEEIDLAKAQVDSAETALRKAEQNLTDKQINAQEDLKNAYQDALNTLEDSYLKLYNAQNTVDLIQRTYFITYDQDGLDVQENKARIERATARAKNYLNVAKNSFEDRDIETALSEMKRALETTSESLRIVREISEKPAYRSLVSASDKTSLDNQRSYVSTALTNTVNAQQTISSTKANNELILNAAKADVSLAEKTLEEAKRSLAKVMASARREDIDLYQARVEQAEARVILLENKIKEAVLRAPIKGQITKIDKREGEMVQVLTEVIFLIPQKPFQVEADIPEVDIGKINLGDSSKITLDAFGEKEFSGKVVEIDPAETVIQGVVYYRVRISLDTEEEKIKPGMTANVIIATHSKQNVLILPQKAVIEKEGKKFVRVPVDNKNFKEVEIKTGLRGNRGEVEIIAGLKEGDKVITFLKEK